MNSKLKKQIGRYSGIAGMIFTADIADAQIVYVDTPDRVISDPQSMWNPYNWDVDGDGIIDFQLNAKNIYFWSYQGSAYGPHTSYGIDALGISPLNGNKVLVPIIATSSGTSYNSVCYPGYHIADTLLFGQPITPSLNGWRTEMGVIEFNWGCQAGWTFGRDYFTGFSFWTNGQLHYGWVRIYASNSYAYRIKDYAYNLTPNAPIRAGQKLTSPPLSSLGGPWLYTLRTGNNFSLNIENTTGISKIRVSNLLGQVIINREIHGSDFEFDLNEKGIYILEVINSIGRSSEKIFVY